MITFAFCDQDTFVSNDTQAIIDHLTANPTHTTRLGVMGDEGIPAHYGGGSIAQVTTDPSAPSAGDIWVLHGLGGDPVGLLLALTKTAQYQLSYRTAEGTTVRTVLN